MNSENSGSWATDIRRQVVKLLAIAILLVGTATGYNLWSHVYIEGLRESINNYHLMTNTRYLRAMEELRDLQRHLLAGSNDDADRSLVPITHDGPLQGDNRHSVLYHLIEKNMQAGLEL